MYCRDVSAGNSEFYSLPLVRMGKILEETPVSVHALVIGDFDKSYLEGSGVTVHRYHRWFPNLGVVSLYVQLFVLTLHVGYRVDIDGFSNVWAHYNLSPVLIAGKLLRRRVFARVFGMGNLWDRAAAERELSLMRPLYTLDTVGKRVLNRGEAWLLNRVETVYSNAISVRELLISNGVDSKQFAILSQGVDTSFFNPGDVQRRNRILFVGRLSSENKRFSDAYEVYRRVKSYHPNVSLSVAGHRDSSEEFRDIFESDDVRGLGFLDRSALRAEYRRARVLLLTSEREGVPNVILEAQACGLPVVATEAGDVGRVLEEGCGGIVQAIGDVASLAESVRGLLEDESYWERLNENGRTYVEENHSFEALRDQYLELFLPA